MEKNTSIEEQEVLNEKFLTAVILGNEEKVLELLQSGADINTTNINGDNVLFIAADRRKLNVFETLLNYENKNGIKINLDNKNYLGETALMHLIKGNNFITYIKKLIEAGANPNIVNNDGLSPLIRACGDGKEEIVDALLSTNIDINYTIPDTLTTAFLMATTHGHLNITKKLYKAGANVNAIDKQGNNALLNALFKNNSHYTKKEKQQHIDLCMTLIELSDINYVANSGITAFWIASATKQKEACLKMLDKNVNVDVWHKLGLNGKTSALHLWCKIGDEEMIEKIIAAGGKLGVQDSSKNTPEAYAFMRPKLRPLMLKYDIDPNTIYYSENNKIPIFSIVVSSGDKQIELVKEMISKGAKVTYDDPDLIKSEPIIIAIASSAKLIVKELLKTKQIDVNKIYKFSEINPGITLIGLLFNGIIHGGLAAYLEQKKYYENLLKAKEINENNGIISDLISKEEFNKIKKEIEQLSKLEENIENIKLDIFKQLISNGAKLNIENEEGLTEVFFATKPEYISLLSDYGANIFHKNKEGQDLLYYSVLNGKTANIAYLKEEFSKQNHKTIDNLFYQLAFEDINNYIKQKNIENGLYAFLNYENNPDLQKLMNEELNEDEELNSDQKSDKTIQNLNIPQLNYQDEEGNTPLLVACANENGYLVSTFLKMGAKINLANNNGETPLMHALATENLSLIKFLIEKGADIHAVTKEGVSILDMAQELNNKAILDELSIAFEKEKKKNSLKP